MVDLQFNYPVLPGEDEQFAQLLRSIAADMKNAVQLAPWGGHGEHRRAAAEWLSRRGKPIDPARVLIGSGGHNGVMASLLALGLMQGKIAVDPLTYSGFKGQAGAIECSMIACEGDEDGMLPDALAEAAKQGAKAVYLMPTVHNPLGTVMPTARREAIVEVARKHNLTIIDDDAYGFLDENAPPNFAMLAPERSIYIASFTKPFAPVLKIAFLAVPDTRSTAMAEKLRALSSGASALLAEAAVRLVLEGSMEKLIVAKRREAAHRQKMAAEAFAGLPTQSHPTSYHVWIELKDNGQSDTVEAALNAKAIQIVPAKNFVADSNSKIGGLRVALGAVRDENILRGALEMVAAEVRNVQA